MKFRIENEPTPVTVPVRLARSENNVDIFMGNYCYLSILPTGRIQLREFWKNSPMYDFCHKHRMAMDVLSPSKRTLALEKKP